MILMIKEPSKGEYEVVNDFTGTKYLDFCVPVQITVEMGYGSDQDGDTYEFHGDDEFKEKLFALIQENLHKGTVEDRKIGEFQ